MKRLITLFSFAAAVTLAFAQHPLQTEIESILKDKQATVGVAVMYDGRDIVTVNNQEHYPTMSTYKFHLALAVLDYLDRNKFPLDTEILVSKSDLLPETYSPLRDAYPEGDFKMSVGELLKYTVSQSDNNACDLLFRYVGGTKVVDRYIASLGVKDFVIAATEEEMHQQTENQYLNWTTPFSAVLLLEVFQNRNLFASVYKDYLTQLLLETSTGSNKIKGLLPADAVVGHKTGSSSRDESGMRIADNDMGFVRLPSGKRYSIAIYVMNSMEDDATNVGIIADVSKAVYEYYHKAQ